MTEDTIPRIDQDEFGAFLNAKPARETIELMAACEKIRELQAELEDTFGDRITRECWGYHLLASMIDVLEEDVEAQRRLIGAAIAETVAKSLRDDVG